MLDFDTIQVFNDFKIIPPASVDKLDDTIKLLEEKKAYYLKMREEKIANNGHVIEGESKEDDKEGPKRERRRGKDGARGQWKPRSKERSDGKEGV